jgi:hypothetical protein
VDAASAQAAAQEVEVLRLRAVRRDGAADGDGQTPDVLPGLLDLDRAAAPGVGLNL